MGSTHIDGTAPGGADFAGAADGGVLAKAIRTVADFLALGLRSFRERVLA
jgi:hypothetical protein